MPFLLELKPLTSDLLTAAVELDRLCFGGLWTIEGYRRELNSPNSDLLGLVIKPAAQESRKINESEKEKKEKLALIAPSSPLLIGIGCQWAILEEAHITLIGIHPDYQGKGLGQTMFHALLKAAVARQMQRATLEVRASNQRAIALYKKFGFREVGRRQRYYQDTDEDALIMWLNGLHKPEFGQLLESYELLCRDRLAKSGWYI
ncbi:MAG: ribosomal protein S18-alanine N-acetyltransferase [Oscillatoriaceae bacterium SKW80]|nr:ribosomal protein S18-alanine N-acetyltransferase [Oscillatoriaceae bacterium SKYG93]MCX8119958.1 ribosomal protein S18-alanine N-acetyltransferase [Oscillatoriaceae bacterium SKW80]MDW8454119.1 ribosomal protein S18-alanine N-acetyltransferase [Oscillatoriaceae cyanobacterium SKYGB_i_bin93]HIK29566.1 ribosomal protein S18-alanine N-acetyltransferase [Oscillatoriaceae cyanobacterium M7585_C2015_266]